MSVPDQSGNFIATHSQLYRNLFYSSVATRERLPFLIPQGLAGAFIFPLVYLSIPHKNRPWLYSYRWTVAAFCTYINIDLLTATSAANEAVGFAVGLVASWGIIWSLTFLIFTKPQWDAQRVARVPSRSPARGPHLDESHRPWEYDYVWEPYPEEEGWLKRLGWTAALLLSFRGTGWNWAAPSAVPSFPPPPPPDAAPSLVPVEIRVDGKTRTVYRVPVDPKIPARTSRGNYRSLTYVSFFLSRMLHITWSYLLLDLWTVTARQDPYFIYGRSYARPLPAWLSCLPRPALGVVRSLAGISGIAAALFLYTYVYQLVCVFLLGTRVLGAGGELWQYPTLFGEFKQNVLYQGMRGFWGGWWHQTFRKGFTAPVGWLGIRDKNERAVLETAVGFLLSGILHACGGVTSAFRDRTWFWGPVMFFVLQGVGCMLQTALYCKTRWFLLSKRTQGLGNLLFVTGWLHLTGWLFIDDMSSAGVWMFEPIPVSVLRLAFGWGAAPGDENWWRWAGEYGFSWYSGRTWGESGIRV